ncbi:MAG: hypothetical protein GTO17_11805 [Candidatus Aminicenantes bacterium]|nr:hypothetical protein [Candidatus Aminicenantes bacterium]
MSGNDWQYQDKIEGKAIEHYEKFLNLWKDADPGIPLGIPEVRTLIEDAKKRLAGLKSK